MSLKMISNEKVRELIKPLRQMKTEPLFLYKSYFQKNQFVFSVVSKKVMKASDELGVRKGCSNYNPHIHI